MLEFHCKDCNVRFDDEGRKFEYQSPVYGPCWKMIADCPNCGEEADEYRAPRIAADKSDSCCGAGGCPGCACES